jgi:hypothetical protein
VGKRTDDTSETPSPKVASTPLVLRILQLAVGIATVAVALFGTTIRTWLNGGRLGEYELDAGDCRSGFLLQPQSDLRLSAGGICSKACTMDHDCGDALRCFNGNCAPRGAKAFGQPCDAPWDCQSDICGASVPLPLPLTRDPAFLQRRSPPATCGQGCADGKPCPDGYDCTETTTSGFLCAKHREGSDLLDILQKIRDRNRGAVAP